MGQKRRKEYPYRLKQGGYNPKSHQDLIEQMMRIKAWMKERYRGHPYSGKLVKLYKAFKKCEAIRGINPLSVASYCKGWQKMYIVPTIMPNVRDVATTTDIKLKYRCLFKLDEYTYTATAYKALTQLVNEGVCKLPKDIV